MDTQPDPVQPPAIPAATLSEDSEYRSNSPTTGSRPSSSDRSRAIRNAELTTTSKPVMDLPTEIWQQILNHLPNSSGNRSTLHSLLLSSRAVWAVTIDKAETKLLAMKLNALAQRLKTESYSPQSGELFQIIIEAARRSEISKNRVSGRTDVLHTTAHVALHSREKAEVAIMAANLVRALPLDARFSAFNTINELIDSYNQEWAHAEGANTVKVQMACRLAGQIGHLSEGEHRLSGFHSLADSISRFTETPGRQSAIAALASQMHHVLEGDNPASQFNRIARTIDSMSAQDVKTAMGIALAKQIEENVEIREENAEGAFGRLAWMINRMDDSDGKASIAIALTEQLEHIKEDEARVNGFNHIFAMVDAMTSLPAKADMLSALAAQLDCLPQDDDELERFNRAANKMMSLPYPGKSRAAASLAKHLQYLPPGANQDAGFDRIVRMMGISPKAPIAAALAQQLQHFPEQDLWGRNSRFEKFSLIFEKLDKLDDDLDKACVCAALASQLQYLHLGATRIETFHSLAAIMDGLTQPSAKAMIAAALVEQFEHLSDNLDLGAEFNRMLGMMQELPDATARSTVAEALVKQFDHLTEYIRPAEFFNHLFAVMDDVTPPAPSVQGNSMDVSHKAGIAAGIAEQLPHLETEDERTAAFARVSAVLKDLVNSADKREILSTLAHRVWMLPQGPVRVAAFDETARSITPLTDPDAVAVSALASQILDLPAGAQRINGFISLVGTMTDHADSTKLIADTLAKSLVLFTEPEELTAAFSYLARRIRNLEDPDSDTVLTLAHVLKQLQVGTSHVSGFHLVTAMTRELADSLDKTDCISDLADEAARLPVEDCIAGFSRIAEIIENLQPQSRDTTAVVLAGRIQHLPEEARIHGLNRAADLMESMTSGLAKGNMVREMAGLIPSLPQGERVPAFNQVANLVDSLDAVEPRKSATVGLAGLPMHLPPEDQAASFDRVAGLISSLDDLEGESEAITAFANQIAHLPNQSRVSAFDVVNLLIETLPASALKDRHVAEQARRIELLPEAARAEAFNQVATLIETLTHPMQKARSTIALVHQILSLPDEDRRIHAFERAAGITTQLTVASMQGDALVALIDITEDLSDNGRFAGISCLAGIINNLEDETIRARAQEALSRLQ